MARKLRIQLAFLAIAFGFASWGAWWACCPGGDGGQIDPPVGPSPDAQLLQAGSGPHSADGELARRFSTQVKPFLERYCISCHRGARPKGGLDLTRASAFRNETLPSEEVPQRLEANEMPPESAPRHPEPAERAAVVAWLRDWRAFETERNSGDPGIVLARR